MKASLSNGAIDEPSYRALFNAGWYLSHYQDVAAAGMDPWQHFMRHGIDEQRSPCPVEALSLEEQLWRGNSAVLGQLQSLAVQQSLEGAVAGWVLARWHASHGNHAQAEPLLRHFFSDPAARLLVRHSGPWLLLFSVLWHQSKMDEAKAWLNHAHWPQVPDLDLARFMLPQHHQLAMLNGFFQAQGLCPVVLQHPADGVLLDNLAAPSLPATVRRWWQRRPLVSVIMPCYNAEATIATALRSLQQQTWRNLEILVVDDASTDNTAAIVAGLAAQDKRITLLRQDVNKGAYSARNTALAVAKGRLITTHDCDDWSHPQKIERQASKLLSSRHAVASISHWARCTSELNFTSWRQTESWVYRNVSSLMFRRLVLRKLGFWDNVSVNADTEYYYRIIKRFGNKAIAEVMPGIPLAFGRFDEQSLTQQSQTHLRTQLLENGLRRRYHQAALQWHSAASARELYLPQTPVRRPFAVPAAMCRGNMQQQAHNLALLAGQSGLFNAGWYLRRYPDVATAGMKAWHHYLHYGYAEGRDPGPRFSTSGYYYQVPEARGQNPLQHLLHADHAVDYALPDHQGQLEWQAGKPVLLMCAHQVSEQNYGAERSFLEVMRAAAALSFNLVVALPSAQSQDYVEQVRQCCHQLVILPYAWWHGRRQAEADTQAEFVRIIERFKVSLVYCNTLALYEPLLAARQAGVACVTHVRELPEHDAPLCADMQAGPQQIRQHLLEHSDCFIANSQVVADFLNAPGRVHLVPNTLNAAQFELPFPAGPRLQLAMISSNLPKKGLDDFVRLAALLHEKALPVDCLLVGPENKHTQALQQSAMPPNLIMTGYLSSSAAAIAQADVVVNLSRFQESFGRTVLEAMAAARPVICYRWGALPEVVRHQETGFLVPLGDIDAVAGHVAQLLEDNALRQRMGQAGRAWVKQHFSPDVMQTALAKALARITDTHIQQ
ncbi:glycosyltransferase [Zobellella iuensis]|uniref:Glycosyltransferase n=1 Tax=Zobellella iuensis TaxID=2803811 RepID=A0ABS1QSB6_9GAMM|nr:glycosyltransferase [Zobellella iuensis]MBL1377771.1 glycosyltransferase [Zobellella iuensis]